MGWAVERAHPQGISLVISLHLSASTPAHPNVQNTPHGGRGEPRAIALRWSQAPPSADCLPGSGGKEGGGRARADTQSGWDIMLIILEAPQTTLPWPPPPQQGCNTKGK